MRRGKEERLLGRIAVLEVKLFSERNRSKALLKELRRSVGVVSAMKAGVASCRKVVQMTLQRTLH